MGELIDILGIASIPSACLMAFLNWRLKKIESNSNFRNIYSVMKDPRYLATINNLSEPVVKTASKTMKVTYTITEA